MMASIGERIINSTLWTAVETWGRQAAWFAIFIILARLVGPEAFGLAALAMVAPVILATPVTRGIPDAIVQRSEIDPIHLDSAFWLLTTAGVLLTLTIWLTAGLISDAFGEPLIEDLVRWTSVTVTIYAVAAVPTAVLKRQLNFRLFALRTLVGTIVGGSVGVCMAVAGFGVWSLVAMQVTKAFVETGVLLIGGAWRPRLQYSQARCNELFGFAGPLIIQSLWNLGNEEMPKVILGAFLGPYAVGVYMLARRCLEFLSEIFLAPITHPAMSAVSRMQNNPEMIDRFFDTAVRMASVAGFPAFVGFAAIAPAAVPFIFGEQWINGILVIQLLMLLGLQRTIDGICVFTLLALGHSGLILKVNIIYTILASILLVAAAQLSLEATVLALVACNVMLLPVFLYYAHRIAQIDVLKPLQIFPRIAMISALMFTVVSVWVANAPTSLPQATVIGCGVLIGALIYAVGTLLLVRPELVQARDMLLRLRG